MKLSDDDFTLFGLPARHALDVDLLDARWRELQGRVHPDRFVADGASAQRLAMQWAVRINEAYRRLKDPMARGAALCALRGVPVDAERGPPMPAPFLLQQMQWREALDEATDDASVSVLDVDVATAEVALVDALRSALDERGDTSAAAEAVRGLMFLARFRADIGRRLDALAA